MRLRLTRLVLITCMALLGIIALQVFWLFKAYKEQQNKLWAVTDNALMQTQILTGVNSNMRLAARSLMGDVLKSVLQDTAGQNGPVIIPVKRDYHISLSTDQDTVIDPELKKQVLGLLGVDTPSQRSFTIHSYKEEIKKALLSQQVDIPFELALIDINDRMIASTADTASFQRISLKTKPDFSLPVTLNAKQSGKIQLAFPGATFFLLKGMGLILLLSLLFITVCAFSFSYMVALFYKQKKIAEIKSDFMNNMTHELKTPISSVSVALELLRDESVPVTQEVREEYFGIADNELKRLTLLVDKVLRMAAFEKMQVKVNYEWFAVRPWIEHVLHSVKPLAEAAKADIAVAVQPENLQFYADKDHMVSVLQNLLENALKYADRNKPEVIIGLSAYADESNFYMVVKDNGTGIAPQYQQRIFDKFFRVPTGDEHETKGYGLGLSYVHEIVQLHRGNIQVESEWKKGATFTISIPKTK